MTGEVPSGTPPKDVEPRSTSTPEGVVERAYADGFERGFREGVEMGRLREIERNALRDAGLLALTPEQETPMADRQHEPSSLARQYEADAVPQEVVSLLMDAWHEACHQGMTNLNAARHQAAALRDAGHLALADERGSSAGTENPRFSSPEGGLIVSAEKVRELRELRDRPLGDWHEAVPDYYAGWNDAIDRMDEAFRILGLTGEVETTDD